MKKVSCWKRIFAFVLGMALMLGLNTNSFAYAAEGNGGIFDSGQPINIEEIKDKAIKIKWNRVHKGEITETCPEHYYKFTLDVHTNVGFAMISRADIRYALYNSDGYQIGNSAVPGKEEDSAGVRWWRIHAEKGPDMMAELYPGTYYLIVAGNSNSDNAYGRYQIDCNSWHATDNWEMKIAKSEAVYTGKKIALPKVTLYDYNDKKVSSDKYDLIYSSMETGQEVKTIKNVGKYYIQIKSWKVEGYDSYVDEGAVFVVKPVKGTIKKLTAENNGTIKIVARKDKQCTGWQVQVSRNSRFKGSSVRTINITENSKKIEQLTAGVKYYVRIRNYKTYENKLARPNAMETVYGDWSSVKTITCK